MVSLLPLVQSSQQGDLKAFTELIQRTRNLALGYAMARLGDWSRAQDVVQDAYLTAFSRLHSLKDSSAFLSWLRGIVHHGCLRVFRSQKRTWLPLEEYLEELEVPEQVTQEIQRQQDFQALWKELKALPEHQRVVVTLYYLDERSQQEVADFLELPVSKVNNDLHQARQTLKRRLKHMGPDTFDNHQLPEDFAQTIGHILSVQGHWVEATTAPRQNPQLLDILTPMEGGSDTPLLVVQKLHGGKIRCLSLGDSPQVRVALQEQTQTGHSQLQLSEEHWKAALANFRKHQTQQTLLHTGIKCLDLFCPLREGDTVGVFGREGVGRAVLVMELLKRQPQLAGSFSILFFVDHWNALGTRDFLQQEPAFATDVNEKVDTAWLVHPRAADPDYALQNDALDVRLFFSPHKAARQIWPALEPLYSTSRALTPEVVGERHFQLATKAHELLEKLRKWTQDADFQEALLLGARQRAKALWEEVWTRSMSGLTPEQQLLAERGRKLEAYLSQPFFVAEEFTGMSGQDVSRETLLNDVESLLNGEFDHLPLKEFQWKGGVAAK